MSSVSRGNSSVSSGHLSETSSHAGLHGYDGHPHHHHHTHGDGDHAVHGHQPHRHAHQDHTHDQELYFMIPKAVVIQYGPYTFHGVCDFRIERLQGIQKALQKMGAQVTMVPNTDLMNRVQVWYMESVIFSCKITELQHGGDGELDNLCMPAAHSFDQACRRSIHGLRSRIQAEVRELKKPKPESRKCHDEDETPAKETGTKEMVHNKSKPNISKEEKGENEENEKVEGEGEDEEEYYKQNLEIEADFSFLDEDGQGGDQEDEENPE